ncbi:MAG TPA: hypothetical protein VGW38_04300 [Chloroflexota bacterium]|nr:hypothetical protein [Chloroflexota bacterium]
MDPAASNGHRSPELDAVIERLQASRALAEELEREAIELISASYLTFAASIQVRCQAQETIATTAMSGLTISPLST